MAWFDKYIGRWWVYAPDHPRAGKKKAIKRAQFIMEHYMGRFLEPGEVVHHINQDKSDDRLENLQLMSREEHSSLHHAGLKKVRHKKLNVPHKNLFDVAAALSVINELKSSLGFKGDYKSPHIVFRFLVDLGSSQYYMYRKYF